MESVSRVFSNRFVVLGIRIVLGIVFISAAIGLRFEVETLKFVFEFEKSKIAHPGGFAEAIYNYRMLPYWAINLMAIVMPWLELICGILLIVGVFWRGSALMIGVMLAVFIVALSSALYRGLDISCGCFTIDDGGHTIALDLLIRDILMFAGAAIVVTRRKGEIVLAGRN